MIQYYFDRMLSKMQDIEQIKVSSHLPRSVIETVEQELLISPGYLFRVPKDYPSSFGEKELRARRLKNPTNTKYLGMLLRLGMTTLHVQDSKTRKNLDSIVLVYLGCAQKIDLSGVKAYSSTESAIVNLLDNGVVSASYFNPGLFADLNILPSYVVSWYPEGKEKYAGWPYPANKIDVSTVLNSALDITGKSVDSKAWRALPDLVMLAVESYEEFNKENA